MKRAVKISLAAAGILTVLGLASLGIGLMQAVMYPAFPPVVIHTTYILYISLLCTILLVLLYKNRTTYHHSKPPFCPFLTIQFPHIRLQDV